MARDVALAVHFRLLMALARLRVAPDVYRRLAKAVPNVGRDALVDEYDVPATRPWVSWSSRLRHLYVQRRNNVYHPAPGFCIRVEWRLNGHYHRDADQPTIVWQDGDKSWRWCGLPHRSNDKPAFERWNGKKEWYRHGVQYFPPA